MINDSWTTLNRLPSARPARSRHGIAREVLHKRRQQLASERNAARGANMGRCICAIRVLAAQALNRAAQYMQRMATALYAQSDDAQVSKLTAEQQKAG